MIKIIKNNFNYILSLEPKVVTTIIVLSVLVLATFLILSIVFGIKAVQKKKAVAKDDATINLATQICESLGNGNIQSVNLRNSRIELTVDSNLQINKEQLTKLNLGATLSGNTIKLMIKDNAKLLAKQIKKISEGSHK